MNQVAKVEEQQVTPFNPGNLLQTAVQNGLEVEKLSQLMELQRDWQREQAKSDFLAAMTRFQLDVPVIERKDKAHNSKYAKLERIADTIRQALSDNGLSYRWEVEQNGSIAVTCIVSHINGHSERTTMSADRDDSGSKNAIQAIGSSDTYLKRYTLISALGITTADEDDDGNATGKPLLEQHISRLIEQNEVVRNNLESIAAIKESLFKMDWSSAAEAIVEMGMDEYRKCWVAPTKGGIWTVAEREKMKSEPDFKQAMLDAGADMSGN